MKISEEKNVQPPTHNVFVFSIIEHFSRNAKTFVARLLCRNSALNRNFVILSDTFSNQENLNFSNALQDLKRRMDKRPWKTVFEEQAFSYCFFRACWKKIKDDFRRRVLHPYCFGLPTFRQNVPDCAEKIEQAKL